ncbi:unnamed protein product [Allacma fusca]|uniref:Uncharacterized protein n=1 Tax=Allacma fusca TaxID=39272 RepID=A0A8J2KCD2_9HEXA|nr:unnamed protein product [Allacma fusca]
MDLSEVSLRAAAVVDAFPDEGKASKPYKSTGINWTANFMANKPVTSHNKAQTQRSSKLNRGRSIDGNCVFLYMKVGTSGVFGNIPKPWLKLEFIVEIHSIAK